MKNFAVLHEKALQLSKSFRDAECALVDVLQRIDECRGYRELGYPSLFRYATQALGLSEGVSCSLIAIARKAKEVPELKKKIEDGEITISNAKIITSVLTAENQKDLLEKAESLPKRELEREVAKAFPDKSVLEKSRYVAPERIELQMGISPDLEAKLTRAQDLVSRSLGKAASLEETLTAMTELFLERKDPVRKAERITRKANQKAGQKVNQNTLQNTAQNSAQSAAQSAEQNAEQNANRALLPSPGKVNPKPFSQYFKGNTGPELHEEMIPEWAVLPLDLDPVVKRVPIPVALKHALNRRDQGRCTHHAAGVRCTESRWLDFHHRVPKVLGGRDTLENLVTLCRAHHLAHHDGRK